MLREAAEGKRAVSLNYGSFLHAVFDFFIVAVAIFMVVKAMNRLKRRAPLAPGERRVVWVAFGGRETTHRARLTRLTLVLPGLAAAPVALDLVAPGEGATHMVFRTVPLAMYVRTGLADMNESSYVPTFELEALRAYGRFVVGAGVVNGLIAPVSTDERRVGGVFAIGPRAGWLWRRSRLGIVGGVEGGYGVLSEIGAERGDGDYTLVLRMSAALRLSLGQAIGATGAFLPARHRTPSPFRTFTMDLGYAHWLARGRSLGGGVLFMVGAPLFSH